VAKVVLYLRAPGEASTSLARQEAAVRRWAQAKRHRIVAVTRDTGVDADNRDGLVEALSLLRAGNASALLVQRMEILGDDIVMQEQLVEELRRLPARILAVESPDPDGNSSRTVSRREVRRILHEAAENEPLILALRARANGHGTTVGSPAYGFRVEAGERLAHDEEQAAVARIAELRAHGATLRAMARTLEAEGHRPKRSARWHPETIRRILNRLDG
jgi:hypothetical protein